MGKELMSLVYSVGCVWGGLYIHTWKVRPACVCVAHEREAFHAFHIPLGWG